MRLFMILLSIVVFVMPVFAQEQTLISGDFESGGFGGPGIKFTQMNGELGILVGGRGGWIINHTIVLGGGGYGLVNEIVSKEILPDTTLNLDMGYGGFEIGYIHTSDKLLHYAIQILIGAGEVSHTDGKRYYGLNYNEGSDTFFIIEPSIDFVLNVTPNFRLAAGASYRYISGVSLSEITNSDLSGPSAQITLKFGSF